MVPKLRFPEFKGSEWKSILLGQLIEIKGRIGYRGYTVEDIVNKGEGAISLSPSNIDGTGSILFNKSTYISWPKYEESPEIMLEEGLTVLVKTGSTYGKTAFVKKLPEKATINPQLVVLKPIHVNSIFLSIIVSHSIIQKQIKETVVGGAIPTLSQDSISKFEVVVPSKKEQQKIADCLSSLDELITAQNQKLDALKDHKKGLMQQLFPAEGETVPKLRFEEFKDSGEWEETNLEQIGEFKNGINFSPEKKGNGYLTVDVLNMYGLGIETKLDSLYRIDVDAKDYLLQEDDILFVRSSMKREGVGWVSLFKNYKEPVLFCGFLIRLRIRSFQLTNPLFLAYFLRSEIGREKIISLSGTAAITNISQDSLKQIPVPVTNILEQKKIADCLSSLDGLITAQAKKIEALKEHKKGLMQGLFPQIDESN